MNLRSIVACVLAGVITASSAQAQSRPDDWRSYAERLGPRSLVTVRLLNGARVQGHIIQVTDGEVSVLPKTRIPVPVRHLALADVQSIEVQREGLSPGAKVLAGVGAAGGVLLVITVAMFASLR